MTGLRILAVEDDPDLAYLYESFLRAEGHEVRVARDSGAALELIDDHPDVVLLDLMLPGGDGYAILHELRARDATRRTRVIVVSAAIPPGRHRIAGADAVVHKPFGFEGLLRTIDEVTHLQHAPT